MYMYFYVQFLATREAARYYFCRICLSGDNFRKSWSRKFIGLLEHPVYLLGIQVKFVYEGHRVKVKVTGAKKVDKNIPIPAI